MNPTNIAPTDISWRLNSGACDSSERIPEWIKEACEDLSNSTPDKLPENWSVIKGGGTTYIEHYCRTGDRFFHVFGYWSGSLSSGHWSVEFIEAKVICVGNNHHMKYDGTGMAYLPGGFDRTKGLPTNAA